MNSTRWREVEAVLDVTLDSDPSDWPAILEQRCAGDAELRTEVEALLRRYDRAVRFLDSPPLATAAALVAETQAAARHEGKRVGPYRIVRQIGEGGTARVYLAERDDGQFSQRVALKLLRPGHDSEIDQGRFRVERQILASLNHPNIARLLDGGMSDDGLPYLVMELIEGEPIDRYCETNALPLRQRLEMFATVCEATQYAHRNLVVHRDLKPSNVLVTAEGEIKLLDFGLARLLEQRSDDPTSAPLTTQRWMTPEYAAPEQVRGETATTLTDVYQLGVVLYELLTGTLPFGRREQRSYDLAHAILEHEPDPPSSIGTQGRSLRGDLDAIVLHALRKEPEQRYASAEALRDDVERHLTGLPVRARHGNVWYRAATTVRRHRWIVAAAATLLLLLTGYAATLTVHARRMRESLARVELEKTKAEGSTAFLVGLFSENVPGFGPRDTLTAQQLLARGERQANSLRDQPLAYAQLVSVLGTIHHNMNDFDRAQALLERALTLRRAALGDEHLDVAESNYQLGMLARSRGNNDRARDLLSRALETQVRVLGEDHRAVAETRYRLSLLGGDVDERITVHRRTLATSRRVHGPEHPVVAEDMMRLGTLLRDKGLLDDAENFLRESLAMRRRVSPLDHRSIARHLQQLAIVLKHKGELAEAEQLHRSQLATLESIVGPDHPELAGALRTLAEVLILRGQYDEAERLARRDVAIHERAFGEQHLKRAESLAFLSWVLQSQGKLTEAEALRRRELAIRRNAYGFEHVNVVGSLHGLAILLLDQRRYADAERVLLEAKSIRERRFGSESPPVATILPALARLARERGDFNAADSLLARALRIFRAAGYDDRQQDIREAYREQQLLYDAWGRPDGAALQRRLIVPRE
jgi:serine/threonine-protein kinase